jgi:hypothetical protein
LYRLLSQEALWNGNRERLWEHFSRKSLFLWALRTHPRYRREYPLHFQQTEYAHLKVIRLRSPRAAQAWLSQVVQP